ncbi:MAG: cyanophycin synthetase [Burkholderiaceae bacterium]
MEISRLRALRGPNLWSRHTSMAMIVACQDDDCAIETMPGFEQRLRSRFPRIGAMRSIGASTTLSMAHVLQHAALRLQAEAGCPVTFGATVRTVETNVFQVVVQYTEEAVGRLAVELAQALCAAALHDLPFDLNDALDRLRTLDEDLRPGPSTGSIIQAAVARGIPYRRLTEGSLVQFGWGSRQRRVQAAEIDATSAIAESIAQDKYLTKRLLEAAGVPVPPGRPVRDIDDAWQVMQEIGEPVVVKPLDGNQGKGVTVNVETLDHLKVAYQAAREYSRKVLVERFTPGHDFRMLVVGERLIAAARRDPPHVIGDGEHTIEQLVEEVNRDPARSDGHATSLTRIRIDEIAIARMKLQGYAPTSIPARGQRVVLRNNANLSTGGTATDVTDDVHPEFAARAVEAARIVGLDICGVDVVAQTETLSLENQGGAIVEVNAAPGLRMHLNPSFGSGRAVGEAIVGELFAPGDDGRIPLVAVTGTNGKTTTVRLIASILAADGLRVGYTATDGIYVDGRRIDTGDCSGPRSARNVLLHPQVDAAVLETARGGILREGLGFDRCQVAVVTNIGTGDHLGLNYIHTVQELAVLKRVVIQNVADDGYAVLNAADPIVAAMAQTCPGAVILFAADPELAPMQAHRAQGKRVVFRDGADIVAAQGAETFRIALARVPVTRDGTVPFQVENAMAAVATGWALNRSWAQICDGLAAFEGDADTAPGRFNVMAYGGATVIADYGHNPDAISALVAAVEAMPARRRSVVISGAGDRRDVDIREQTRILGDAFDSVVLYEDQCQRGRADGEVIALLRQGLADARRAADVHEIRGEFLAIDTALERLEDGDVCLILVDQVEEALAHLKQRIDARRAMTSTSPA